MNKNFNNLNYCRTHRNDMHDQHDSATCEQPKHVNIWTANKQYTKMVAREASTRCFLTDSHHKHQLVNQKFMAIPHIDIQGR